MVDERDPQGFRSSYDFVRRRIYTPIIPGRRIGREKIPDPPPQTGQDNRLRISKDLSVEMVGHRSVVGRRVERTPKQDAAAYEAIATKFYKI